MFNNKKKSKLKAKNYLVFLNNMFVHTSLFNDEVLFSFES